MKKFLIPAAACLLAACSATGPQFSGMTPPAEGMGKVYVYRPSAFVGGGSSFTVSADSKIIGHIRNNGYFSAELPPGEHEVWAKTEVRRGVAFTLQEGETRCVKAGAGMGILAARPTFENVSLEQCRAEIGATRHSSRLTDNSLKRY